MLLSKKLEEYIQMFTTIDIAFRKIKSVTDLQEINTLVEKFLTKEDSLQDLTNLIRINKKTLEEYIIRNAKLQKKIVEISICDKNPITGSTIKQLNAQIVLLDSRNIQENHKVIQLTSLKTTIMQWAIKVIRFLNQEFVCKKDTEMMKIIRILRDEVRKCIKPVEKFAEFKEHDFYNSSLFVTDNPVSLRTKDRSLRLSIDDK